MPIIAHEDLDGFVSALLATEIGVIVPSRVYTFSYSPTRDEQWKELLWYQVESKRSLVDDIEDVWFVDISLRKDELAWAKGYEKKGIWHWVDHHKASEDFNPKGIFHDAEVDLSGNVCAADLLWKRYLQSTLNPNMLLKRWVNLAHYRDLWTMKSHKLCQKLDMIVKSMSRTNTWELLLQEAKYTSPEKLVEIRQDLWITGMAEFEVSCKLAKNTAYQEEIGGYPFILCYTSSQESDVSMTLYGEKKNEVICMIVTRHDSVGVSLRTLREDIDLNTLAKVVFNGGGHAQAAGGRLSESQLMGGYTAIIGDISDYIYQERRRMTAPKEEVPKKAPVKKPPEIIKVPAHPLDVESKPVDDKGRLLSAKKDPVRRKRTPAKKKP